jgi:Arc/MetJ family transcription regulator
LRGRRIVWGGRARVREGLYVGALIASRFDPSIKEFYGRLVEAGKPTKVALVASMRKLLVILNAVMRERAPWRSPHTLKPLIPHNSCFLLSVYLTDKILRGTMPHFRGRSPDLAGNRSRSLGTALGTTALRDNRMLYTLHIGRCTDMRTNIVLDDELIEEAFRYADVTTKRELVDLALREFVENHRRKDMRELRGKITFHPGYDHKRLREGS